jgi:hypothetical protein
MGVLELHSDKYVEEPNTGCFIWMGALANGRPQVGVSMTRKGAYVSRLVCEEVRGPPPTSKHDAAHNTPNGCVGGLCVNGDHLRWATRKENMADVSTEQREEIVRLREANKTQEQIDQRRGERHKAKLAGEKTYFSGTMCPRGHIDLRFTRNGGCVECHRLTANNWRRRV